MRGALMLTAARTPYRRAGLAFPVGVPLTVAVLSLKVPQLRLLLTDDAITILVGQANGGFVKFPELTNALTDAELQDWIDSAPAVELEDVAAPVPVDPEAETLSVSLSQTREALATANAQVEQLQDQLHIRTDSLTSAEALIDGMKVETERLLAIEAAWKADQRHLHDQGFQTLDALTSAWAVDRAKINAIEAEAKPAAKAKAKPTAE